MGEMCDFEAEYYPGNWLFRGKRGTTTRVSLNISLSKQQKEKVRILGGVVALRKMIDDAPIPEKSGVKNDQHNPI